MDTNKVAELVQDGVTWPQAIVICIVALCIAAVLWKLIDAIG